MSGQHRLCVQSPAAGAGKGLSEGTEMMSTGSCGRGHSITAPRVGAGVLVHPDREWVEFLLWGSRQGFQIGFSTESVQLSGCVRNMLSLWEHKEVVQAYLDKEVREGRVLMVGSQEEWHS